MLQRPDIPFSREDANRYLPWVIAVMVCLVGLLLAVGISLHQASKQSGRLNIQSFQIYLPNDQLDQALIDAVTAELTASPNVKTVEPVSSQALERLIAPWTGGSLELEALPLPMVLEVTLKDTVDRGQAIGTIRRNLQAIDASIDVESYQEWVEQLTQFTHMLRIGVFSLVGLLCLAMMALVTIIVRTSLKLNFHAVRLLHNVGATDEYIIRQFVANGCLMVLKGSVMGMGIASVVAVVMSYLSIELSSPLLPTLTLGISHILMLIGLPVLVVILTAVLIRITIMQMLEQMH